MDVDKGKRPSAVEELMPEKKGSRITFAETAEEVRSFVSL